MNLYAVKIPEYIPSHLYEKVLSKIESKKQMRIKKFIHYDDSVRGLISEVLAIVVLNLKLGIDIKYIYFHYNKYGKPYLQYSPAIYHNISHSGDWVVMALDDFSIGIDIEEIKPVDYEIAKRFFSKEEVYSLGTKIGDEKLGHFYDLWTLKESYIKAVGKGLSIPLHSFSIDISEFNITLKNYVGMSEYYFKQYPIENRYKLSVCSTRKEFCDRVCFMSYLDLFNEFLKLSSIL